MRRLAAAAIAMLAGVALAQAQGMTDHAMHGPDTSGHEMHGHDMHGGGPLPPVAHHLDAPAGAAHLAIPGLGVEIVAIHLSAAGSLVDLRYRVLDVDQAKALLGSMPAALIDPRSGAAGQVPVDEKVGALRQNANQLRPGQVLAVLFGNPDRSLKKGDPVVIRLGGWEIAGLAIQG